jgi:hypothetical protein
LLPPLLRLAIQIFPSNSVTGGIGVGSEKARRDRVTLQRIEVAVKFDNSLAIPEGFRKCRPQMTNAKFR